MATAAVAVVTAAVAWPLLSYSLATSAGARARPRSPRHSFPPSSSSSSSSSFAAAPWLSLSSAETSSGSACAQKGEALPPRPHQLPYFPSRPHELPCSPSRLSLAAPLWPRSLLPPPPLPPPPPPPPIAPRPCLQDQARAPPTHRRRPPQRPRSRRGSAREIPLGAASQALAPTRSQSATRPELREKGAKRGACGHRTKTKTKTPATETTTTKTTTTTTTTTRTTTTRPLLTQPQQPPRTP